MKYTTLQIDRTLQHIRTTLIKFNTENGHVVAKETLDPIMALLRGQLLSLINTNKKFIDIRPIPNGTFAPFFEALNQNNIAFPKSNSFTLFKSGASRHYSHNVGLSICKPNITTKTLSGFARVKVLSQELNEILSSNHYIAPDHQKDPELMTTTRAPLVFSLADCLKPGTRQPTDQMNALLSSFQFKMKL